MIKQTFNLLSAYCVVLYLRMSDKQQNSRSPDQQKAEIQATMKRLNCPWRIANAYRDDFVRGRYNLNRPEFQKMLRDIFSGRIKPDLIVVDTWERFGRLEEFEALRRKLRVEFGVLIVTADSGFADPTGIVGKAVGMVESIRSTEDGRIKAHNVVRGKKDAVRLKRWPGGPRPFGYGLQQHIDSSGPVPRVYSVPIINSVEAAILLKVFAICDETGSRGSRIAKTLNADPNIPGEFKPFYAPTIDYWLGNPMYIGTYIWGEHCTDIEMDHRIIQVNPDPEAVLIVEGYCEPIVPVDMFYRINKVSDARELARKARVVDPENPNGEKLIPALAGGISVKYAISGLVRCGHCNSAKVPKGSGRKSKSGKSYAYYACPRALDGACDNSRHVSAEVIEKFVFVTLRTRLFPLSDDKTILPEWFPGVVAKVEGVLDRKNEQAPDFRAHTQREINELGEKAQGFLMSLADTKLRPDIRASIQQAYEQTVDAKHQKEIQLQTDEAVGEQLKQVLDPLKVIDRLKVLDEVIRMSANKSYINIELARHIDHVACYLDGTMIIHGTYLGVLEGAQELLAGSLPPAATSLAVTSDKPTTNSMFTPVKARRLARRRIGGGESMPMTKSANGSIDPRRFEGLAEAFVWHEKMVLPVRKSWADLHATEVYDFNTAHPEMTWEQKESHFSKTKPTLKAAIRIAVNRQHHKAGGDEASAT